MQKCVCFSQSKILAGTYLPSSVLGTGDTGVRQQSPCPQGEFQSVHISNLKARSSLSLLLAHVHSSGLPNALLPHARAAWCIGQHTWQEGKELVSILGAILHSQVTLGMTLTSLSLHLFICKAKGLEQTAFCCKILWILCVYYVAGTFVVVH